MCFPLCACYLAKCQCEKRKKKKYCFYMLLLSCPNVLFDMLLPRKWSMYCNLSSMTSVIFVMQNKMSWLMTRTALFLSAAEGRNSLIPTCAAVSLLKVKGLWASSFNINPKNLLVCVTSNYSTFFPLKSMGVCSSDLTYSLVTGH